MVHVYILLGLHCLTVNLIPCLCHPTVCAKVFCFRAVSPPRSFVHPSVRSSGQIFVPWYIMNSLSNCDETYRQHSLAATHHDLNRFLRSKVKVIASHRSQTFWTVYPTNYLRIKLTWYEHKSVLVTWLDCTGQRSRSHQAVTKASKSALGRRLPFSS